MTLWIKLKGMCLDFISFFETFLCLTKSKDQKFLSDHTKMFFIIKGNFPQNSEYNKMRCIVGISRWPN